MNIENSKVEEHLTHLVKNIDEMSEDEVTFRPYSVVKAGEHEKMSDEQFLKTMIDTLVKDQSKEK
jgi:hypothetical protein